jgi:hypothetical protein
MKIKELFEDDADNELADLIKVIKTVCPKNFKALIEDKAHALYRGTSQGAHAQALGLLYFASPGRALPRESKTDSNVFISFATFSPLWKDVPRRSYCNSASTSWEVADQFEGRAHLIIPADSVKSFACMETDFNKFDFDGTDLLDLSRELAAIKSNALYFYRTPYERDKYKSFADLVRDNMPAFSNTNRQLTLEDIQKLSDAIESIKKYFKDQPRDTVFDGIIDNIRWPLQTMESTLGDVSLMQWLEENLRPDEMSIRVSESYEGLSRIRMTPESEIWFEGEYLALRFISSARSANEIPDLLKNKLKGLI